MDITEQKPDDKSRRMDTRRRVKELQLARKLKEKTQDAEKNVRLCACPTRIDEEGRMFNG